MKTRIALAALLLAPFVAQADDSASVQRCMDSFAAQNFPDSSIVFVVKDEPFAPLPLIARTGTQAVQLIATSKTSGRVLATATCKVRVDQGNKGKVVLLPLT